MKGGMTLAIRVETILSMPFAENSYVAWREGFTDAIVIDPGFEPRKILAVLERHNLKLVAILNTHGHVDHIAGNAAMKQAFPEAPIIIGRGDAPMLTDADLNLSGDFGLPIVSPAADRLLDEGDVLEVAGMNFQIMEIPGHSPGHIVFYQPEARLLFGGDVLFAGSIGRTDFPGGSLEQLLHGIRTKLWPLPDDVTVHPGHNEQTTIGEEKQSNPFLK